MDREMLREGDFSEAVLEQLRVRGQAVDLMPSISPTLGDWIGIQIDPETRKRTGGASFSRRAHVEGY
jgi:hypothetical protein